MISRVPSWIFSIHKKSIFRIKTDEKVAFLTFDDGPVPGVTDWVLDLLREHNIKASFFVLGKQVEENPELYQRIFAEGHVVGNHSYSHPNGWQSSKSSYLKDFEKASTLIDSEFFRPPYGKIKWSQLKSLSKNKTAVFWDVLSGDYSHKIGPKKVVQRVCESVRPGSVVVMHDSLKAEKNLKGSLEQIILFLKENNYRLESLPQSGRH